MLHFTTFGFVCFAVFADVGYGSSRHNLRGVAADSSQAAADCSSGAITSASGLGTSWYPPAPMENNMLINENDRAYRFGDVPDFLLGGQYIGSKPWPSAGTWEIAYTPPVTIYVWVAKYGGGFGGLDSQLTESSGWRTESVGNFRRLNHNPEEPISVWSKFFESGSSIQLTTNALIVGGVVSAPPQSKEGCNLCSDSPRCGPLASVCGIAFKTVDDVTKDPLPLGNQLLGLQTLFENNVKWFWNWNRDVKQTDPAVTQMQFAPTQWSPAMDLPPAVNVFGIPKYDDQQLADLGFGWNEPDYPGPHSAGGYTKGNHTLSEIPTVDWPFNPEYIDWFRGFNTKGFWNLASPAMAMWQRPKEKNWLHGFYNACAVSAVGCPKYANIHFYYNTGGDYHCPPPSRRDRMIDDLEQRLKELKGFLQEHGDDGPPGHEGIVMNEFGITVEHGSAVHTCSPESVANFMTQCMDILIDWNRQNQDKPHFQVKYVAWFNNEAKRDGTFEGHNLYNPNGSLRPHGIIYKDKCRDL